MSSIYAFCQFFKCNCQIYVVELNDINKYIITDTNLFIEYKCQDRTNIPTIYLGIEKISDTSNHYVYIEKK